MLILIPGQTLLEQCIVQDKETENLYIVTAGALKVNALEFLSSEMISTAVEKLTDAFESIIISGLPALAVSDAILLGRVDGVILLVKAGDTAQEIVQKLRAMDVKLLGAVLSQVDIESK